MEFNAQFGIDTNVTIALRDAKSFKIIESVRAKNRVTNLALSGIVKMIYGEFGTVEDLAGYVPRYFALGGETSGSSPSETTVVPSPTDTQLEYEITDNEGEIYYRIPITQKNIINTNLANGVIKIAYRAYTPGKRFNGMDLFEAGLFTSAEGNTCFARIGFPTVVKQQGTVLDILWEINVRSMTTEEV